jgi:uncharacterized protein YjbI with pentapeptide repeats
MCKCSQKNCDLEVFENKKCVFHCDKSEWKRKSDFIISEYDLEAEIIYFWDEKKVNYFWFEFKKFIEIEIDLSKEDIYYRFSAFEFPELKKDIFDGYTFRTDLVFTNSCIFEGNIEFFNVIFKKEVYFDDCKIKGNINLGKSIFEGRFTFNNMKNIKEGSFRFAKFEKKVEFKETDCKEIDFYNVTFKDLVDFYNSNFMGKTNFERTTFKNISVLTKVIFKDDIDFKYTTFEKLAQFEETIFEKKLNLENTIIKDKINFLKTKTLNNENLKPENIANRETARIIKDSFEQQNNIIEANKFYALEMKEREKELEEDIKEGKNFLEWLVFKIHGISSNHSQDWLLALYWIFIIGFISSYYDFNLIQYEGKHYELSLVFKSIGLIFVVLFFYSICKIKDKLVNGSYFIICFYLVYTYSTEDYLLSLFSKTINPFSVMKTNDAINGIQLLFKIIIAYLIYQLIISIRQNTRRK